MKRWKLLKSGTSLIDHNGQRLLNVQQYVCHLYIILTLYLVTWNSIVTRHIAKDSHNRGGMFGDGLFSSEAILLVPKRISCFGIVRYNQTFAIRRWDGIPPVYRLCRNLETLCKAIHTKDLQNALHVRGTLSQVPTAERSKRNSWAAPTKLLQHNILKIVRNRIHRTVHVAV